MLRIDMHRMNQPAGSLLDLFPFLVMFRVSHMSLSLMFMYGAIQAADTSHMPAAMQSFAKAKTEKGWWLRFSHTPQIQGDLTSTPHSSTASAVALYVVLFLSQMMLVQGQSLLWVLKMQVLEPMKRGTTSTCRFMRYKKFDVLACHGYLSFLTMSPVPQHAYLNEQMTASQKEMLILKMYHVMLGNNTWMFSAGGPSNDRRCRAGEWHRVWAKTISGIWVWQWVGEHSASSKCYLSFLWQCLIITFVLPRSQNSSTSSF